MDLTTAKMKLRSCTISFLAVISLLLMGFIFGKGLANAVAYYHDEPEATVSSFVHNPGLLFFNLPE